MRLIRQPLHKPPYVHNWVRYNHNDEARMVKHMVAFEKNRPQVSYLAGQKIIADRILWDLDAKTAIKAAQTKGHAKSRPYVLEYVKAHLEHEDETQIAGLPAYDELIQPFRINREVSVPVKPLAIVARKGKLVPVFMVGWSSMPLDTFQRRLLMTVLEDAVFSLEDFRMSPGVFLSYPRGHASKPLTRKPQIWHRGDYNNLSTSELTDHLKAYVNALQKARTIISTEKAHKKDDQQPESYTDNILPLFDF